MGSASVGLAQQLPDRDPVPLLADQTRRRWGEIGDVESSAKGTGESIAVAGGEGLELLLQLEGDRGIKEGIRAGGLVLMAWF